MFRLYVNAKKAAISLTLAFSLVANGTPTGDPNKHKFGQRFELDKFAQDASPDYTKFYFLFKLKEGETELNLNSRLEGTSERGKQETDPVSGERKLHPVKLDASKLKFAQEFIKEAKAWRDDLDACAKGKTDSDAAAKSFVALLDLCVVKIMSSPMMSDFQFAESQVGQCWIDLERAVKARGAKITKEKSDKFLSTLKDFMGALDVDRSAIEKTQEQVKEENSPRVFQRSIFDAAEVAVKDADKADAKACAVVPPAAPATDNKPTSSSPSEPVAAGPESPSANAPASTDRTQPTGEVPGGPGGIRRSSNARPDPNADNDNRAGGDQPLQPGAPGGFTGPLQPNGPQSPFDASALLGLLRNFLNQPQQALVTEPRSTTGGTNARAPEAAQPALPSIGMPTPNNAATPPPTDPNAGNNQPQMIAGPPPPPPVTPSPTPSSSPYAGIEQLSKSFQAALDSIGQKVTDMNKATNETMNSILAGMAGGMGAYNPFAMQQPQQVAQQTPGINTVGNYLANGRSSTNTFANGRTNTANTSLSRGRTPSGRTSPDQFASTFEGTGNVNFNTGRGQSPAAQPTGDVGGNYRGNL